MSSQVDSVDHSLGILSRPRRRQLIIASCVPPIVGPVFAPETQRAKPICKHAAAKGAGTRGFTGVNNWKKVFMAGSAFARTHSHLRRRLFIRCVVNPRILKPLPTRR